MASDEQSKQPQSETAKSAGGTGKAEAGQTKQAGSGQAAGGTVIDAITLLKNDHREVEKLFAEYEKASNRSRKQAIIQQVAQMLKIHSELEEAIFYPAVRQQADADDKLDEAQVEHDTLKILIADLEQGGSSEFRDAKVKVLSEYVKHHVQEEEASGGILEQGRKGGLDLKELGEMMAQLKQELESDPSQLRAEPVSLQQFGQSQQRGASSGMQRSQGGGGRGMQERDEQGRFMEKRSERGRQSQSGGYRGGSSRSEREYRGSEGRGGGQGQGWHGDPRGHSEAARRGWDEREQSGSSRGGRGYDDDNRRSGSSRGGGMRGEGQGGWFGDPQGHSEAARRGWQHRDDDDRGGRSRSGYQDDDDDRGYYRSRHDDEDDRRYRSRSQQDDDDGGRERGGWFGDPRGHSEAARRGWDNRR